MNAIAPRLLAWFEHHGRHDLPWQDPRTPYRVWLSEIMLQQTQVRTVIPYFERFVAALPTLPDLAAAPLDAVLGLWSGLGYYSRARNLHRAAGLCVEHHGGDLPRDADALAALPGIGRSTAAAILAQAWGDRHAILDGNVKRVLARFHGVDGWPGSTAVQALLWRHAEAQTPDRRVADYTQAIMDLGATVCTRARPTCLTCPLAEDCVARREDRTRELPAAKPARTLPLRHTTMLIARAGDRRVLLERRPPTGVWAQLWSLPETDDPSAAAETLRRRTGGVREAQVRLPPFEHVFSHFRLNVTPLVFDADATTAAVADAPEHGWFDAAEWATLGLPAPVRRLLEKLETCPE
ncbi:A/G-specific adenine glycosylase [Dokdonella koreensis]|uniref:Adenine DNA glycosylase n=1 Tax=Dokdonella koreensis DS-123 TaxID=1300342 RepID=A0A160DUX9_9GAMM|nr:A/G-specific adenine glycosylase [Dokdonella koreensis]ANB18104.1 A/G-specific adenine glycosylase [Dokdonella koreensis DS-123]